MSKCFFWVFYVFDFKWHFLANSWHALCVFATNSHLLSSWAANRVKHGERQATALAFLFCSFLLAESVNPCFHCASFVNTPKLSTRMRLPRLALFQRIKANVFARWHQVLFPFPPCCFESNFLLEISKASCCVSNLWFQMKLWLEEATSGWCSFEKPCVFRPVKRSQNNTKKVRKSLFSVFTCWA